MPTWVPGSNPARLGRRPCTRGFTLIELMVVVAIVALAAGLIALALPDPERRQLDNEGARLVALLESARTEARAAGLTALWVPRTDEDTSADGTAFRFVGLSAALDRPTRWLDERTRAQVVGAKVVTLGPDAILPPQRIVLRLGDQQTLIGTDGLSAFTVLPPEDGASP